MPEPKRRGGHVDIRIALAALAAALIAVPSAQAHAPGCRTHRCDRHAGQLWAKHHPFTGYVVEGKVSTFGVLTGDSEGQTADGGSTARPCIAIRDDSTLGRWFEVSIDGHHARLLHCDWGPASFTGRSIDVTGYGDEALGFSPGAFPTEAWGVARELR